jgi:hypothetical protein
MKNAGHLLFGLAARARPRKGQRDGHARWREDEVRLLVANLGIEVDSKLVGGGRSAAGEYKIDGCGPACRRHDFAARSRSASEHREANEPCDGGWNCDPSERRHTALTTRGGETFKQSTQVSLEGRR